jgi:hypothetical protein
MEPRMKHAFGNLKFEISNLKSAGIRGRTPPVPRNEFRILHFAVAARSACLLPFP